MLEIKDLVVAYGKVRAVKGISFIVEQGQVVSLIGAAFLLKGSIRARMRSSVWARSMGKLLKHRCRTQAEHDGWVEIRQLRRKRGERPNCQAAASCFRPSSIARTAVINGPIETGLAR